MPHLSKSSLGMSDVLFKNEYEGPISLETAHSGVHRSGTLLGAFTPPAFSAGLADVRLTELELHHS